MQHWTEHRLDTFEHSTMDADYIYQNFGDSEDIHVIQDSDQFLLISFTKKDDRPGHLDDSALHPSWEKSWPLIGFYWKLHRLRWLIRSGSIDPLKRQLFRLPVRLHCGTISESDWRLLERRAAAIVAKALSTLNVVGMVLRSYGAVRAGEHYLAFFSAKPGRSTGRSIQGVQSGSYESGRGRFLSDMGAESASSWWKMVLGGILPKCRYSGMER